MSILRRMRDISVATLNEILEQAEDPIRLIDKYLGDLREQLQQSERLYQQCLAHSQSLRQQYLSAGQMAQKREQQAVLALKAGEEEMARLALHEKAQHEERGAQYKELYDQTCQSLAELEEQLQQMREDYREVADKRSYYLARLESVRLQQRMNQMRGASGEFGRRSFQRLEERVTDMEFEARTLRDVRRMGQELYRAGAGGSRAVEAELERLRRRLEQEGWKR